MLSHTCVIIHKEDTSICPICLDQFACENCEEINQKTFPLMLNCCQRYIHQGCLLEMYIESLTKCPLCRQKINMTDYFYVYNFSDILKDLQVQDDMHLKKFKLMETQYYLSNYSLKTTVCYTILKIMNTVIHRTFDFVRSINSN